MDVGPDPNLGTVENNRLLLVQFRTAIADSPVEILLLHHGQNYELDDVFEVLHMVIDEKYPCRHCGHGHISRYVVRACDPECDNTAIFLINHSNGCLTYDPRVDVESFDTLTELKWHLQGDDNIGYTQILKALFRPPHPSTYLERFRSLLDTNRKLILTHRGDRYKAKTISEVLYTDIDRTLACSSCCSRCNTTYIVQSAGGVIFFINYSDGCLSYSESFTIASFADMDDLKQYLTDYDHGNILAELFPNTNKSNESDDETSDSF